jgi:oxidoreductase AflY
MDPLLISTSDQITHHLLALWALGASPEQIQEMFDYNTPYQVSIRQPDVIGAAHVDMADKVVFDECLGKDEFYADYLQYFENEIAKKGMQAVVKEYVLEGDERANDIFCRMFTGASAAAA